MGTQKRKVMLWGREGTNAELVEDAEEGTEKGTGEWEGPLPCCEL